MDKAGQANLANADEDALERDPSGEAVGDGYAPEADTRAPERVDSKERAPERPLEEARAGDRPGAGTEGEPSADPEPDAEPVEPAGSEAPYWLGQVPYFLVLSALAAGIVVVAAAHFKRGPAIIAGALMLAATFRLFLPEDWLGMLAVRRRWIDLLTLTSLAVLLIVLAWVAPQLSA